MSRTIYEHLENVMCDLVDISESDSLDDIKAHVTRAKAETNRAMKQLMNLDKLLARLET